MTRVILFSICIISLGTTFGRAQGHGKREAAPKGEEVIAQCTGCHSIDTDETKVGPSLKGLFKKRQLLNGRPATEANIRLVIKRGVGGMPAFETILPADQLDSLVAFLKSH
jgi:mono/diheme cytochrome c family protein